MILEPLIGAPRAKEPTPAENAAALACLPTAGQLLERIRRLSAEQKTELDALLMSGLSVPLWVPQVGPQQMAAECQADILFYGGAAGGGKTDLLIGLAITEQQHSILFRRFKKLLHAGLVIRQQIGQDCKRISCVRMSPQQNILIMEQRSNEQLMQ